MPKVTLIRPKLTVEVLNKRLHNYKLVAEEILSCECKVFFENEELLNLTRYELIQNGT